VSEIGVPPTAFKEGSIEVDGGRLRYMEAGRGDPLVHLQEPGVLRPTAAHELLARRFHVVNLELPESDSSPETLARAVASLGLDTFNLMATSSGAATALRFVLQNPQRVLALVLESPTDLEGRLAGLATPTLVLFGTRDALVPPAMGPCHLVFVYDAARAIGADRPEAFAEVVGDFLERRDAFVISRAQTVIHP
jgi:pimeloyl-ACP methyl ester carboxylesterase